MNAHHDNCPKCHADLTDFAGIQVCEYCAWEPQDELGCPRCLNTEIYDAEATFCHNCGYTGLESAYGPIPVADGEEFLAAEDLVKHYGNTYQPSDWAEDAMNTKTYTYTAYQAQEPYQPFFDLIEDLKKWHVTVRKTSDKGRFHTWVNKTGSKAAGCDITGMAKAVGPYVWIPEYQWGTKTGYLSLVHEGTHAKDFWKFGTIFFMLMQNLLPFGPSFVALFEYRAYVAAFKAEKEVYGSLLPKATERVAAALASRGYRYCFPFPKLMKKLLDRAIGE